MNAKVAFLKSVFGTGELSRDGKNLAVRCPNAACESRLNDGKRKFSIHVETDKSHCWVCGFKTHDTLIPALRKAGVSRDDIQTYAEKFQSSQRSRIELLDDVADEPTLDFPKDFVLLGQHLNSRDLDVRHALAYLRSRGLTERDIWFYKFGISRIPKFCRRVIMPSFDSEGYLNFYTARAIDDDRIPKYLNPDVDKLPVIFNELNLNWKETLTIVEGPFDLVKCNENATCLQGSEFSEDYLLFWKIVYNKTPVVLALDKDVTRKTNRYASLLNSYDIPVRILQLGEYNDVGEMSRATFLKQRDESNVWTTEQFLRTKIASMSMRNR
jgi:hypothetical protein